MSSTARAAERVARASYGRILAILAARSSDIARAEDALSDALAKALVLWPTQGIPDNPDGWVMRVARNRLIDQQRRATRDAPEEDAGDIEAPTSDKDSFPDKRLELMLVCAHPSISPSMHTPLMLQCVMGLDAAQIAQAFVLSPSATAQRLVRAKSKIKAARIPFNRPSPDSLQLRLPAILNAIYASYSVDWLETGEDLGLEALYLADLLTTLVPDDPEVRGLAALIGFGVARREARLRDGIFVPLDEQDPALWNEPLLRGAQAHLRAAQNLNKIGRYQLEAAIQAAHARRIDGDPADDRAIAQLYSGLCSLYPTAGAQIGFAAAAAKVNGAENGLALLDRLDISVCSKMQSYHATRAHLLALDGQLTRAAESYTAALGLTNSPALTKFLEAKRHQITKSL